MLLFGIASCEKMELKNSVVGKWELAQYTCGECPAGTQNTFGAGNGNYLELGPFGEYKSYLNGLIVNSGSYKLKKSGECKGETVLVVSGRENGQAIEVNDGKLVLRTPSCFQDGATSYYTRIY